MSKYNTDLQRNNTELDQILQTVNNLPEAGGGVPVIEEKYELIEAWTTTVSEKLNKNTEPDGTPYDFKRIKLLVKMPVGAAEPGSLQVQLGGAKGTAWLQIAYVAGNAAKNNYYETACFIDHGFWAAESQFFSGNANIFKPDLYPGYILQNAYSSNQYPAIIKLATINPFPIGTEFKLYAVRRNPK